MQCRIRYLSIYIQAKGGQLDRCMGIIYSYSRDDRRRSRESMVID